MVCNLYGLKHHSMEINGDVTMETNNRKVKIGLISKSTMDADFCNYRKLFSLLSIRPEQEKVLSVSDDKTDQHVHVGYLVNIGAEWERKRPDGGPHCEGKTLLCNREVDVKPIVQNINHLSS